MTDSELVHQVWPAIEKMNMDGQSHTKIAKSMLVIMPSTAARLEKSSKGTVLRRQAEERYESDISRAYQQLSSRSEDLVNGNETSDVQDYELPVAVLEIIKSVIGKKDTIPEDADLFAYGVDSLACMQIRAFMQRVSQSFLS